MALNIRSWINTVIRNGMIMTDNTLETGLAVLPVGPPTLVPTDLLDFVEKLLAAGHADIYRSVIQEVDRHLLPAVMDHSDGNQSVAASRLGLSRMTLRSKMRAITELPLNNDLLSDGQ